MSSPVEPKASRKNGGLGLSLLAGSDIIISLLVVGPLVVGYWRGSWSLLDEFLYPEDKQLSFWLSTIFGFGVLLGATWFQKPLDGVVKRQNLCSFFFLSRLYTVILCFGCVNVWRGVWGLFDVYTGTGWWSVTASLIVGTWGLIILRAFRNILAPPLTLMVDEPNEYFKASTMFHNTDSKKWHLKLLDVIFSVVFIGTLVVLVWRGAFAYLEMYMFPTDPVWTAWGCTILGYSASLLAFVLQIPLVSFFSRVTGFWRLFVYDLFVALAYVGCVNIWRGFWGLYDLYFIPDPKTWSCLITHLAGLIITSICYCAHSILVRGVLRDAEEPGGDAAVFPCFYLRYFFKKRQQDNKINEKNGSAEQQKTLRPGQLDDDSWIPEESEEMMKERTGNELDI